MPVKIPDRFLRIPVGFIMLGHSVDLLSLLANNLVYWPVADSHSQTPAVGLLRDSPETR